MGTAMTNSDLLAEYADRVIDLEAKVTLLEKKIQRVGKEKRTCAVDRAGWLLYSLIAVDVGLGIMALIGRV